METQSRQVRRRLAPRERRILLLAAVVAMFFLASTLLPALQAGWQQRQAEISRLRDELERERRLYDDAALWQQRRADIELQRQTLGTQVFTATTVPLLSAAIQQQVRELATAAGMRITAASLAESHLVEGWLLVEQRLDFSLDNQGSLPLFLQGLNAAEPRLGMREFNLRHNRNLYTGQLTVVGFARVEDLP